MFRCYIQRAVLFLLAMIAPMSLYADPAQAPSGKTSVLFAKDTMYILSLLGTDVVQSDLRLTESQKSDLLQLSESFTSDLAPLLKGLNGANATDNLDIHRKLRQLTAEHASAGRSFIDERLSESQSRRLKQIYWQQIGPAAFGDNEVTAALSLANAQLEAIAAIQAEHRQQRAKDLKKQRRAGTERGPTSGPAVRIRKPSAAFTLRAMQRLTAVLTETQQKMFRGLVGQPLAVDLSGMSRRSNKSSDASFDHQEIRKEVSPID